MSSIITYDKMKSCGPLQKIDLRIQVDHMKPKRFRHFEEYDENPTDIILYGI